MVNASRQPVRKTRGQFRLLLCRQSGARSAAALALTSLLVVGLGAVLRSTAGTITTAVAVLFAPPILGALLSNEVVATVMDYLPTGLTTVLVSGAGERYSPAVAALLLGAWAVGALAAGVIALHRRDPTILSDATADRKGNHEGVHL